jgi:hypothetical protein
VDLTFFGGADPLCQGCVGCAFANRHFYLQYQKADAFPSTLTLLTPDGAALAPLAVIGQTRFLVEVQDKNGDLTANADQLQVLVANPNLGDSLRVTLIETGPHTAVFRSADPVLVLDVSPAATGAGQMAMSEGDSVWVTYSDPTDSDDSSSAYLYTPASFPQAERGWFLDVNADGAVDKAVVLYSKAPASPPDSLQLWFPDPAAQRTVKAADGGFRLQGARLEIDLVPPFAAAVTGFTGDNRGSGRSFLIDGGKTRISAFALADSAGPVLTRVVLAPASAPGQSDTLTVSFSEPVNYARGESHPFQGRQASVIHPASEISVAGLVDAQSSRLILLLDPASPLLLAPGDSLRIAAGIADLSGNKAAPANRFVVVEGDKRQPPPILKIDWDSHVKFFDSQAGPDGTPAFELTVRDGTGNWLPVQASEGRLVRDCASGPCGPAHPVDPADPKGSVTQPSILLTSDRPFHYESTIFSNLGAFVTGFAGDVGAGLLEGTGGAAAPIRKNPSTGNYEMRLIWNGKGLDGMRAGSGAYIWRVSAFAPGSVTAGSVSSSRMIGLLRRD